MVFESLIDSENSEKKLFKVFLLGILYSSLASILSLVIFRNQASLIMVSLTVFASIPLVHRLITLEEKKEFYIKKEFFLIKEHFKTLSVFLVLFLGFVVSLSLWYVFLPESLVNDLFATQMDTFRNINSQFTGNFLTSEVFSTIFLNNFYVLLFCLAFSFFYGSGAIFILTWNGSVIACAIGNFVKNGLSSYAMTLGLTKLGAYFHIFSLGILRYMTHGIFEITAFFVGGMAGGIISVAVIKHDLFDKNFKRIIRDSIALFLLAILILAFASLVEVYITPILF